VPSLLFFLFFVAFATFPQKIFNPALTALSQSAGHRGLFPCCSRNSSCSCVACARRSPPAKKSSIFSLTTRLKDSPSPLPEPRVENSDWECLCRLNFEDRSPCKELPLHLIFETVALLWLNTRHLRFGGVP
jgi:hypothetical protein